jgi:hypothetical protein
MSMLLGFFGSLFFDLTIAVIAGIFDRGDDDSRSSTPTTAPPSSVMGSCTCIAPTSCRGPGGRCGPCRAASVCLWRP